jgi:hypothetical protein
MVPPDQDYSKDWMAKYEKVPCPLLRDMTGGMEQVGNLPA